MSRFPPIVAGNLLLLGLLLGRAAHAQCMLANPSFELAGSAGATFAGWNQFGAVGSTTPAPHGAVAARASGPNTGAYGVSGFWQAQTCAPGQQLRASVRAWHTASRPVTGQSQAILNIEWRNSSGGLISYESHAVVTALTPLNVIQAYSVTSGPAPAGTATARLLLGALQGPGDPVADVYFDQATFDQLGPPTLDAIQWNDFPGGRTVDFGSRVWRVKGPGSYGPGPNLFDDSANAVWVDLDGRMHLTIRKVSGSWYSTEVALADTLGYGDYVFTTVGRLDALDVRTVLGLYLWQYGPCYDTAFLWWNPYNEIDIEYSRWGTPGNDVGQFVAQPYDYAGNLHRYAAAYVEGQITTTAFRWLPDRVEFRCWRGGPLDENPANLVESWTYTGPHLPRPEQPRVHMNLWQFNGPPATNQEVVIDRFTFTPACSGPGCTVGVPDPPAAAPVGHSTARPNPFTGRTRIRFTLPHAGLARITIYDVAGRAVRRLAQGELAAGDHDALWDGTDDAGRRLAPGVYPYRFESPGVVESRRIILLQ